jgi:hypothetical protein
MENIQFIQRRQFIGFIVRDQWEGRLRKRCNRVNIVEKLCTQISKWKMKPVEIILRMRGVGQGE